MIHDSSGHSIWACSILSLEPSKIQRGNCFSCTCLCKVPLFDDLRPSWWNSLRTILGSWLCWTALDGLTGGLHNNSCKSSFFKALDPGWVTSDLPLYPREVGFLHIPPIVYSIVLGRDYLYASPFHYNWSLCVWNMKVKVLFCTHPWRVMT